MIVLVVVVVVVMVVVGRERVVVFEGGSVLTHTPFYTFKFY